MLAANIINIAADVAAMGDALKLMIGGPSHLYAVGFGLISVVLQVFIPYSRYVRILKWLTLGPAGLCRHGVCRPCLVFEVLKSTVWPHVSWQPEYITTVVAVFGTTISPYLFFWQASQEVEDLQANPRPGRSRRPGQASANFGRIKVDTVIGMGFSISWPLHHAHHRSDVA